MDTIPNMSLACRISSRARVAAVALTLAAASLTGCATSSGDAADPYAPSANDPLEGVNRIVYGFNEGTDILFLRPAAVIYREGVPEPIRTAVRNFLRNLTSPLVIANQLLQGDVKGAEVAFQRLLVNSTIGLGGVFDIAGEYLDLEYEMEDFGQTLAVWGVPEGPYLVLPIVGPSNLRDTAGYAVDTLTDPFNNWANNVDADGALYGRAAASSLETRASLIEPIDDIRRNSLDPYASLRSLYRQSRAAAIRDGVEEPEVEFPDYDDISMPAVEKSVASANSN
ncbi:MAG TPA: VacJ family lipoprotein [Arenibaculum sp.]|nr:VacJ family lipoprotein [Arenibaculum sp.]